MSIWTTVASWLEALAVAHAEVERRADDQDHVGVVERVAARQVEVVRVARRQRAAGGAVHERRDVELADELDRRLVSRATVQTWLPSSTHGRSALMRISVSWSTSLGSPMLFVDAR